jgi:hypothetical protein
MNLISSPRFLPAVLWIDAVSAAGIGVLQVAGGGLLAGWLGLPSSLLLASGLVLFAFAALAARSARSRPTWRAGVLVLIAGNVVWVLGCVELLFVGAAATPLGVAWLALQAIAVGGLALLEWLALRRAAAPAWA